jgi:hypothetical protein
VARLLAAWLGRDAAWMAQQVWDYTVLAQGYLLPGGHGMATL